jgi:hypothetical protein
MAGVSLPSTSVHALDDAAERMVLRTVGGGYHFIHQLLRDYFTALNGVGRWGRLNDFELTTRPPGAVVVLGWARAHRIAAPGSPTGSDAKRRICQLCQVLFWG